MVALPSDFPLLTVGHSNRSWPEFLRVLQAASIKTIFDVRRYPVSRRYPHFSKDEMRPALAAAGVGYRHHPALGGYRDDAAVAVDSINDGWPPGFLRNYADYALTPLFREAIGTLYGELVPGSAVMCAEKDWRTCHRQIIADYAIMAGFRVIHIVDEQNREDGALTKFAEARREGIVYASSRQQFRFNF